MFQVLAFLLALSVSSLHGQQHTINGEQCTATEFTVGNDYQNWYNATEIPTTDGTVMLKFYVVTKSDANIKLARKSAGLGYQIIIGCESNSFSEIRRVDGYSEKLTQRVRVATKQILDEAYPVGFWLHVSRKSGLIMVGKNGENLPFIFWKDPEPIPVNYYSFGSWGSHIGKWMFKCKPINQHRSFQ